MRAVDAALAQHLAGQVVRVFHIAWLDFAGDPTYLHSDIGDIQLDLGLPAPSNGMQTYQGVGNLGEVEGIDEDAELAPDTYTLALSGVNNSLVAHARSTNHLGREGRLYMGARDLVTGAVVGTPVPLIFGELDTMRMQGGGESAVIAITLIDERVLMDRTTGILFSNVQHGTRHPGDGFFAQAASSAERTVILGPGSNPVQSGGGGGGGRRRVDDDGERIDEVNR